MKEKKYMCTKCEKVFTFGSYMDEVSYRATNGCFYHDDCGGNVTKVETINIRFKLTPP